MKKLLMTLAAVGLMAGSAVADTVTLCPSATVAQTTLSKLDYLATAGQMAKAEALLKSNCPGTIDTSNLGVKIGTFTKGGYTITLKLASDGKSVALVPPNMFAGL